MALLRFIHFPTTSSFFSTHQTKHPQFLLNPTFPNTPSFPHSLSLSLKPNTPNFLLFQTHSTTIEATQQIEPTQEELEATGTRLLAQNVNWTCTEQDIRPLFEKYGTVLDIEAEATMNAQAVKKFVEENQKLALECANLLNQCKKWEKECSMYDCDREALMDFGNEADHRAQEAESQVRELEEELSKLSEELQCYKNQAEGQQVGEMAKTASTEHCLVDTLISTLISKDDVVSTARSFLEANSGVEVCQKMLEIFESLKPSTQKVLALASEVKILQKEKDHLRNNLTTAEEEVKVLDEENSLLEKENKRLMKLLHKERHQNDSGGKHNSASLKSNKRKSGPRDCSPIEKKIDFIESGSPRKPLSPLRQNTPESRMHKK